MADTVWANHKASDEVIAPADTDLSAQERIQLGQAVLSHVKRH